MCIAHTNVFSAVGDNMISEVRVRGLISVYIMAVWVLLILPTNFQYILIFKMFTLEKNFFFWKNMLL